MHSSTLHVPLWPAGDFSLKRDREAEAHAVAMRRKKTHGAISMLDGDLTLRSATTKGLGSPKMDAASAAEQHAMAMMPAGATMLKGDVTLHMRGSPTAQSKKPHGALGSLHLLDGDIMLRSTKEQRRIASEQAAQQQWQQQQQTQLVQQQAATRDAIVMGPTRKLHMLLGDITLHGAANRTTIAGPTDSEVAAGKQHAAAVSRIIKGDVLLGR